MIALRRFLIAVFCCLLAALPAMAQPSLPDLSLGFDRLERSLRLTPWQKEQFDAAVNATQKAALAIGLAAVQAKGRLAQELLKDRPDPDALFHAQDEFIEFSRPYVRRAREAWRSFYATLDEDQVRTARAFVEEKLRLIEKMGEHLAQYIARSLQKP